ncbi:MAG: amino acid racemase [Oscillospiraceae bacterium]
MKKIGLIGGLSWQSSVDYYRIINDESNRRLGNNSTIESIMYTTDLHHKLSLVYEDKIDQLEKEFAEIAQSLEKAGAGVVVICSNTMHLAFDAAAKSINVPMIHIVDSTAKEIKRQGLSKVALLGTTFTMTQPFYIRRLKDIYDIDVIVPTPQEMEEIMRIIVEELTFNILTDSSRKFYVDVIQRLKGEGAQGVILGCTEIPMLIKQKDSPIPVFDTTELHALAALNLAMEE